MQENSEQRQRFNNLNGGERQWRRHFGILALRGLAEWKAGICVLTHQAVTLLTTIICAYFLAIAIAYPICLIAGLEISDRLDQGLSGDVVVHVMAALGFLFIAPGAALSSYFHLGEQLEKIVRDEGTFWQGE